MERIARISSVRRKCTSYYGNPSWWITFETLDGEIHWSHTASNAMCGYMVGSHIVNTYVKLTYHTTRKGTVIIDFITYLEGRYHWEQGKIVRSSDNRHTAVISAMLQSARNWMVYDSHINQVVGRAD